MTLSIIACSITAIACTTAIGLRLSTRKLDLLEPLIPAVLIFSLLFVVRPLSMILAGETESYRWINTGHTFHIAVAVCTAGVLSFLLGYFMPSPARRSASKQQLRISRVYTVRVCVVYVLTAAFLVALYLGSNALETLKILARGRPESLHGIVTVHTEYLFVAPVLLSVAATLLILEGLQRNRAPLLVPAFLVAICVAYFYLFGTRRFIIPAAGIPILVYLLGTGRRPALKLTALLIPAFFLITALPFMRTEGARSQIGGIAEQAAFAFTREDMWHELFLGPDTEMLSAFAAQIAIMNDWRDFYYGSATLGDLILAPLPSALIPGKPLSARDQMLVEVFGYPCTAGSGGLCPDFSVVGTFYQDFWIFGVVLGLLFMGYRSRLVWERFLYNPHNPYATGTAATWYVFILIIIRAGFMPAFQWFLYFWIPLMLGVALTSKRLISPREKRTLRPSRPLPRQSTIHPPKVNGL